jgi:hypothetical protein
MTIKMTIGGNSFEFTSDQVELAAITLAFHWLATILAGGSIDEATVAAASQRLKAEAARLQASVTNQS